MFPHTPDNTFLGFVVEEVNSSRAIQLEGELRQNISLVYGKDVNMWKGKEELLRVSLRRVTKHIFVLRKRCGHVERVGGAASG